MSGEHAFEFEVPQTKTLPISIKLEEEVIWVRSKDNVKLTNLLEKLTATVPAGNDGSSTATNNLFGGAVNNVDGRRHAFTGPFGSIRPVYPISMERPSAAQENSTLTGPTTMTTRAVTPAASSFLQGNPEWKLEGNVCINIEGESIFHINLNLSWGKRKGAVKLTAGLKECPSNRDKYVYLPNQIEEIVLYVKLLGVNEKAIETKCIKIPKTRPEGLAAVNNFHDSNECFFTVETLRKVCQVSPEGANPSVGTTKAFEFVLLEVESRIQFKKEGTRFWKASSCSIKDFERKKISLNVATEATNNRQIQIERVSAAVKSIIADKTKTRSKFSEVITFLVGPQLEKVVVYKNTLVEQSPVFEKMFETDMQEKNTGQVDLRNHSVETVDAFLAFLYKTDDVEGYSKDAHLLLNVLALSHEKELTRILNLTILYLVSLTDEFLDRDTVLEMFNAGKLYNITDLKFRALQWIRRHKEEFWTEEAEAQVGDFMGHHKEVPASLIAELLTLL